MAALAEERQLGRLEREFAPKRMHRLLLALYVVTLLQLLFFVVPGLAFLWWLRRTPEFSRRQAAKRLYLFEHGMIVHPRLGDTVTAIRWDSVRLYQEIVLKIVNGLPTTTTHTYTALSSEVGHAGAAVTDFYADPEVWGPWMQDAVVRAQGRTVLEAVLAGETVAFGPSVSRSPRSAPRVPGSFRGRTSAPSRSPRVWSGCCAETPPPRGPPSPSATSRTSASS
ncbi:DUF6585 family protein [Streptomyces sp. NPDC005481]|uniref:DUF6585 family protein n=1 Tax=Streptomyces sp. NPDC005481 TaxID=3154881 RepID=UPI0033A1F171